MDPEKEELKAKANFSRLSHLLVDKGGDALRAALHRIHPPSSLPAVLNAKKTFLQKIRVINASQWDLLFPASGAPDSKNFDVTLLTILLRNICGLHPPATGWNVMPPTRDTSISANITRIKIFRNEMYGHTAKAQLDDSVFETMWQEISNPLVVLGIPQKDINELKEAPLSPEEESYVEQLKEWKERGDEVSSKLDDLRGEVRNEFFSLRKAVGTANPSEINRLARFDFTGRIEDLTKKFHDETREWLFNELSNWMNNKNSKVMIVTAGPGFGKSVLSAKVCELYKERGQLAAYHFCDFRNSDSRNPHRILQSLASQMYENVKEFRDKLTEVLRREHSRNSLSDAFRVLLKEPLHALDREEPMLIVVDALDESTADVKCEFLELISDEFSELPAWIKILITSRPELKVKKKLSHLNPFEILPDDKRHNFDLKRFFRHRLPDLKKNDLNSLISKCEGSFLYGHFLTNELQENNSGIETSLNDFVTIGISGFYEKQFKRLKTSLKHFQQDTEQSIFKSFVNVVSASREPLPIKFLFACMGLSSKEFEIRETIISIMSEILPVYNDSLTVYHKSLWDWLTMNGYEEHAFVGNVADGRERIWRTCKSIYSNIASLRSVLDFKISHETKYALENGGKYLVNVCYAEDFHWLVDVRLNYFKFKFCENLNVDVSLILKDYKYQIPDHLFWRLFQLHAFCNEMKRNIHDLHETYEGFYLQYLANGHFDFTKNSADRNTARDILDKTNTVWFEQMTRGKNSAFEVVSCSVFDRNGYLSVSPDKTLLVCRYGQTVEVFRLPDLKMMFDVEVSCPPQNCTFSPDSSYFLCNSIRSCVYIREQKEVPFIPHGPESVRSPFFSSCGTKLVAAEYISNNTHECYHIANIKVWDVRKKSVLAEFSFTESLAGDDVYGSRSWFSSCSFYTLVRRPGNNLEYFHIFDSTTTEKLNCCDHSCLTEENDYQILSGNSYEDNLFSISKFGIAHFHLPTDEIILISYNHCSNPFMWKDRKCVISSICSKNFLTLEMYDFINKEIIDTFQIDSIPCYARVTDLAHLHEKTFLVSLNNYQAFVLSFEPSLESFVPASVKIPEVRIFELSPDNLYVAHFYENCVLTISSVATGKTLQTVVLRQPPQACWWSELYLWVVFKDSVGKLTYHPHQTEPLGNYVEECPVSFKELLKFERGVLVIQGEKKKKISVLKISNGELCPLPDLPTFHLDLDLVIESVAISSDGCAILLNFGKKYQIWEMESENMWRFDTLGDLHDLDHEIFDFWLAGAKNCRRSLWITRYYVAFDDYPISFLVSIDHEIDTIVTAMTEFGVLEGVRSITLVDSSVLICCWDDLIGLRKVSDGKFITSFSLHMFPGFKNGSFFSFAKRNILVLADATHFQCLKIHNIEKYFLN